MLTTYRLSHIPDSPTIVRSQFPTPHKNTTADTLAWGPQGVLTFPMVHGSCWLRSKSRSFAGSLPGSLRIEESLR